MLYSESRMKDGLQSVCDKPNYKEVSCLGIHWPNSSLEGNDLRLQSQFPNTPSFRKNQTLDISHTLFWTYISASSRFLASSADVALMSITDPLKFGTCPSAACFSSIAPPLFSISSEMAIQKNYSSNDPVAFTFFAFSKC